MLQKTETLNVLVVRTYMYVYVFSVYHTRVFTEVRTFLLMFSF
jgi:hypothetical protein